MMETYTIVKNLVFVVAMEMQSPPFLMVLSLDEDSFIVFTTVKLAFISFIFDIYVLFLKQN